MKITYLQLSPYDFKGGCWFYRSLMPAEALREKGHDVRFLVASRNMEEEFLRFPDVVVLRGTYPFDPTGIIKEFKKRDIRIVYDTDDDYLTVNKSNPFHEDAKKAIEQYKELLKQADVVTVTNDTLKSRVGEYNDDVRVVPNALNFNRFLPRREKNQGLRIGYAGASSHWEDLGLILDPLRDLQKKHDFTFYLQGMCGTPLLGEIYNYKYIDKEELQPERRPYYRSAIKLYEKLKSMDFVHIPFYPPELYPEVLRSLDLDIGIAPLKDNKFNHAKSCIKFYEYVSVGTSCLASDVLPYNKEVNYLADNNYKDWYKKLEKLIKDKKFRDKLLDKQIDIVQKKANIKKVVEKWEQAFRE